MTQEKGRCAKLVKELDEMKKENRVWETKIADLDSDLAVSVCYCSSSSREIHFVAVFVVFSSHFIREKREYITMATNSMKQMINLMLSPSVCLFFFLLFTNAFKMKSVRRKAQMEKSALEKEISALKMQKESSAPNSKKLDELRKQNADLQAQIDAETKKTTEAMTKFEELNEQHVYVKAQLASEKEALEQSNNAQKAKIVTAENILERFKRDNIDLSRKIVDVQAKCKELESKSSQNLIQEHERKRLLASLQEKSHQYELLVSENEMNKDLNEQLKKEVITFMRPLPFCIAFMKMKKKHS